MQKILRAIEAVSLIGTSLLGAGFLALANRGIGTTEGDLGCLLLGGAYMLLPIAAAATRNG